MHITATRAVVPTLRPSNETSTAVPPGLARRDLPLPPGINKKLESGGALPEGILKRFSAVATPTFSEAAPEVSTAARAELSLSLDITVFSLNITV
jgi:hypothetical protein